VFACFVAFCLFELIVSKSQKIEMNVEIERESTCNALMKGHKKEWILGLSEKAELVLQFSVTSKTTEGA